MHVVNVDWLSVKETVTDEVVVVEENNENVVVAVVVVVEGKQWKCGGGGGKTIEMLCWWWWWRKTIELWWRWWWRNTIEIWCWWWRKTIEFYSLQNYIDAQHAAIFSVYILLLRSWHELALCEKSFSRKDSMQRYVMSKHRNIGLTPLQTVPFSQKCQRFRFEHPFTSMIAGMTGSGKTASVRSLLEQASETIYPPPERIVWCYSQWQTAYTEMLVAMPHIEFVKGIPTALE